MTTLTIEEMDLHEAYLSTEEEKVKSSKKFTRFDAKAFINDGWIFNDLRFENVLKDLFEGTTCKKAFTKEQRLWVFRMLRIRKLKKMVRKHWNKSLEKLIMKEYEKICKKRSYKADIEYYKKIRKNCLKATPVRYSQDLDMMTTVSAKFTNENNINFFKNIRTKDGKELKYKGDQFSRQIYQECYYSGGRIQQLQPITKETCSIPSFLREEEISKFASVTLKQAKLLSKIYRVIGVDFKMAIKFNKIIRKRKCRQPWDIKATKAGLTLLDLAKELKAVELAPQENIKQDNKDFLGDEYSNIDSLGASFNMDEDQAQNKANNYCKQENNVNETTYWNISLIPQSKHLIGKKASKFARIISKIKDGKVCNNTMQVLAKWVKTKCTWDQRTMFQEVRDNHYKSAALKQIN